MFSALSKTGYFKLVLIHLAMGFAIYSLESLSVVFLHLIIFLFLLLVLNNRNKNNEALMAAGYMAGAEVFFRMTHGVIFWETGKYSVILFLIIGLIFKGSSSKTVTFWIYLLLLFPGVVVASITLDYDAVFRKEIAFNLSGPVCLGVAAVYCYYKKITVTQFRKVLLMILLPILSIMCYLYLYTPSIGEVLMSGTESNVAASGGYGPNQISTVLGLGMLILVIRLVSIKNQLINIVDILLLGLVSHRALVTFSRGGVITAILCIGAFLFLYFYKENKKEKYHALKKILFFAITLFTIVVIAIAQTRGLIINRYTNRNAAGELEDDITTGRAELIVTELEGFYNNPVIGIGVGKGKEFLSQVAGGVMPSHNEVTRLLAEHGILGIFAILILIFVPVTFWLKFKNNYYFLAFLAFWFLTINHSAMRIALPAFVYGLALLYIVDEKKNTLYR